MNTFLKSLKFLFAATVILLTTSCHSQKNMGGSAKNTIKTQAPNIILILADDEGWSQSSVDMDPRVEVSSSKYLETPRLLELSKQGMRFSNGYAPAPICTPTRRSILCGTSAARSGEEFISDWVSSEHPTMPKVIKQANPSYRTAFFGKWGENMNSTPEECGYDVSHGMTTNKDGNLKISGDPSSGTLGKKVGLEDYYITDDPKATNYVTNSAINFMRQESKNGNPFYMQVSYYAVHLDVVAKQSTIDKYKSKGTPDRQYSPGWVAMLDELDSGVGRLLDEVERLGIADNTYVIYTSDNGGRPRMPGGNSEGLSTNFPLKGAKHSLYEGGLRVPFIVRGPGIKAGAICDTPVVGYDFLPTFYQLAGGKTALDNAIDGRSMVPLFEDPANGKVVRPNDALYFSRPRRRYSAIRQGDYKLMVYYDKEGNVDNRTMFRFNPDPDEENNDISKSNPDKADELQKILLDYIASVNAKTSYNGKRGPNNDD